MWLYTLIGTLTTLLTPFPLASEGGVNTTPGEAADRHTPTESSYENRIDRPLNVGGRTEGSLIEYVSAGDRVS